MNEVYYCHRIGGSCPNALPHLNSTKCDIIGGCCTAMGTGTCKECPALQWKGLGQKKE